MEKTILCAVLAAASASAFADIPINANETVSYGEGDRIENQTFGFLGNYGKLIVGAGAELTNCVIKDMAGNYGGNAHSNTVEVSGEGAKLVGFTCSDSYTQSNPVRGHQQTRFFFTNGAEVTNFKWACKDGCGYSFLVRDASFSLGRDMDMGGSKGFATFTADGSATISGGTYGFAMNSPNGGVFFAGPDVDASLAKLNMTADGATIEVRDGARVYASQMNGSGGNYMTWRIAGKGTVLSAGKLIPLYNASNHASTGNRFIVEDGAAVLTSGNLEYIWCTEAHDNWFDVRNACITNTGSLLLGHKSYGGMGGGTRLFCTISNSTVRTSTVSMAAASVSNRLHLVDGSVLSCNSINLSGKDLEILIRDSAFSDNGTSAATINGSAGQPARLVFEGSAPRLSTYALGPTDGDGVYLEMEFRIPKEGRTVAAPCYVNSGTYSQSYPFPKNVKLKLKIDPRWAHSGTDNTIDLIELTGKGNFSGFQALAATVSEAELDGCTLEYAPNRNGKANSLLRLRAGKRIGLTLIVR